MTQNVKLLHPFFLALIPGLHVVALYPGESSIGDLLLVSVALLAGCAVLYGLVRVIIGRRSENPVTALVITVAVVWFFRFPALSAQVHAGTGLGRVTTAVVAGVLSLGAVLWAARHPRRLDQLNTFLSLTSFLVMTWLLLQVGTDQVQAWRAVRRSTLARELAKPTPLKKFAAAPTEPNRDIYLLILDEYANSLVLRENFGFDNRRFLDSLRRLGFTIPRAALSNYGSTTLSLSSLLNFSHLTSLAGELGPQETDPTLPSYLLENNRTVAFLKSRGYQFFFFPSHWWLATQHNRHSDVEFQAWQGFSLQRDLSRTALRRAKSGTSLLGLLPLGHVPEADHIARTFAGLSQVVGREGPKFVFAHIINPHGPYVFTGTCEPSPDPALDGWSPEGKEAFIEQLRCLNSLVLDLVGDVLQRSRVAPIILLQGDHGTASLGYSGVRTPGAVSPAQARERFGAFGAYYLPAGGDSLFAGSVTLVNVFRKVLTYYLQADLTEVAGNSYVSVPTRPFDFLLADPCWFAGE